MKKDKLTIREFVCLIQFGAEGNLVFLFYLIIQHAGRASYIATAVGGGVTALFLYWTIYLAKQVQGQSLLDMIKTAYGNKLSGVINIMYSIFQVLTAAFALRLFTSIFAKVFILPITPLWILEIIPILIIAFFLFTGNIVLLARWGLVLLFVSLVLFAAAISVGLLTKFNLSHLVPVFHMDVSDLLLAVYCAICGFLETILKSFTIVGFIKNYKTSYKIVVYSFILYTVILCGTLLISLGIVGTNVEKSRAFTVMSMAQEIGISRFIQGMEIFFIIPFLSLTYISVAYNAFCSLLGVTSISKNKILRHVSILLICTGIYLGALSISSVVAGIVIIRNILFYFIIPFCLLILILASFAVSKIKHNKI